MKVEAHFDPEHKQVGLAIVMSDKEAAALLDIVGPSSINASREYIKSGKGARDSRPRQTQLSDDQLAGLLDDLLYQIWSPLFDRYEAESEERDDE